MDTTDFIAARGATLREGKRVALAALQQGHVAEGRGLALKILAALPDDPEALLLAAQADIVVGNVDTARALLTRALSLAPDAEIIRNQNHHVSQLESQFFAESYVQHYLAARALFMDYPMNIQLETVGRCNANCNFCPHEELDRKFDEMSDELFQKIIDEVATTPNDIPVNFYLNVINEPFMDKKIFARIGMINEKIPRATIGLYTNMNVLPRDFFERIRDVRPLEFLNVSFNAANREEYEESMRIDFDRTVANLRRFLAENRRQKIVAKPPWLSRIATLDERDGRFFAECKALFAEFEVPVDYEPRMKSRANWLGEIDGAQMNVPQLHPCMQWVNISVFCDGTVPHCCMDAKGKFAFGNVKERSLFEIYNSPEFRNMRESVLHRRSVYPCNTCALT
jgi:MoaA/NifB/PqqE/SkfB family radical SAM enzyme